MADINDDLITFFEWAILMGAPPSIVPPFQVMQTTLRARSMIVMDMVQRVRPQNEVQLFRDNILISRMKKLKDKDLPMSVRSFIPERYHRYETMRDTNRKIKETTEKLDRIKLQTSKMMEKIKLLNIKKTKTQKTTEDTVAKAKLLEAKLLMLAAEIEKVHAQDDVMKNNAIIGPDATNMDEDRASMAIAKARGELEEFYKNFSSNSCDEKTSRGEAKNELFCSIRNIVKAQPNLILYRTIHKSITNELDCLLHRDGGHAINRSGSGSAEDTIAKNISDSYKRFILRSTQLNSEKDALHTITDNYEQLYTEMHENLCAVLGDVKKPMREEFIKESSHLHLNEGRLHFLQSEIARNKELLRERSDKIRDMADSQERIKDIVKKSQAGLASMVSDMKQLQKISQQLCHMRDLTEKHLSVMRGEFKPGMKITTMGTHKHKKYNYCVPDDVKGLTLVDELKLFEEIPMAYLNTLDEGQVFRRFSPVHLFKQDLIRASRYAHLYTVQGFLRQVWDVCNLQMYLSSISRKRDFSMAHIPVDIEDIRKKEFEQNKSIYRLLQICDQHMNITDDLMAKCRIYYEFLLTTPLKNYISPCTKVEGKSFTQMDNEFLLYYRMIRGVENPHDEME